MVYLLIVCDRINLHSFVWSQKSPEADVEIQVFLEECASKPSLVWLCYRTLEFPPSVKNPVLDHYSCIKCCDLIGWWQGCKSDTSLQVSDISLQDFDISRATSLWPEDSYTKLYDLKLLDVVYVCDLEDLRAVIEPLLCSRSYIEPSEAHNYKPPVCSQDAHVKYNIITCWNIACQWIQWLTK